MFRLKTTTHLLMVLNLLKSVKTYCKTLTSRKNRKLFVTSTGISFFVRMLTIFWKTLYFMGGMVYVFFSEKWEGYFQIRICFSSLIKFCGWQNLLAVCNRKLVKVVVGVGLKLKWKIYSVEKWKWMVSFVKPFSYPAFFA